MNGIASRRRAEPAPPRPPRNRKTSEVGANPPKIALPPKAPTLRARLDTFRKKAAPTLRTGLRFFSVIAGLVGAVALAGLVDRYVRTSRAFAIREIRIEGNTRLDREAVLRAAGLSIGQNVFSIGPEDVARRLRSYPWIRDASAERRLPGTFSLHIEERTAAALLEVGGLYLVSDDGMVFKAFSAGDPVDLPVITGAERERFTRDRTYRTQLLLAIVSLLSDYRGAGLWRREPIGEIHVEPDTSLSLYIGGVRDDARPTHIRLGRGPFRGKLSRLRQVLDTLAQRHERASYVYLDNVRRKDRATVRLQ